MSYIVYESSVYHVCREHQIAVLKEAGIQQHKDMETVYKKVMSLTQGLQEAKANV